MARKKKRKNQWVDLSGDDLNAWAGDTIAKRGRNYQRQGRVIDLAMDADGSLIGWVEGTRRYATQVILQENSLPASLCTCPYELDCKHAVAVVIEYLERQRDKQHVPGIGPDDIRLELLGDAERKDEPLITTDLRQDIDTYLKGHTKARLIDLIHELAGQYPEMAKDLSDRQQLISGNIAKMVTCLRKKIYDISAEPGWQNYWKNEGFTPDYGGVRKQLAALLAAGHTDTVLSLGRELISAGTRQVGESNDHGETAYEVAACVPLIVKALEQSSLGPADKLSWALDVVLEDDFDICAHLTEYLHGHHSQSAWDTVAERLRIRLKGFKRAPQTDAFSYNCARNRLSEWAIHALECAGRTAAIIPLCEVEARKTGSYDRLVDRLIQERRYAEAERWIKEGLQTIGDKWTGVATTLRHRLIDVRKRQKNRPAVAALQVEEFVRRPSPQGFAECRKACRKVNVWPIVREFLLHYLEKGKLPWDHKKWPLPPSGLAYPEKDPRNRYPLLGDLIDIAILEQKPDQVLKWFDLRHAHYSGAYWIDEDVVANAVEAYNPERAVDIWKDRAEQLIDRVKPSAYREAAKYLRKGAAVMRREKKSAEWAHYLKALRQKHLRKRRLLEILDGLDDQPLVSKHR